MATFTNPGSRADLLLTLARLSFPDAAKFGASLLLPQLPHSTEALDGDISETA